MTEVRPYIIRMFMLLLVFHAINKFLLRPFILDNELDGFLQVFTLSVPNFIEAVMGTMVITSLIYMAKSRLNWLASLSKRTSYLIATSVAGVYVITQELKIHNLGGDNTYDSKDIVASVIGLICGFVMLHRYGFSKNKGDSE